MKIVFLTPVFAPSLGGVETVAASVAAGLDSRGHEIVVATETAAGAANLEFPFAVLRGPSGRELRRLFRWADVVWQHQLCLRMLWRARSFPRCMGATFHTWLPEGGVAAAVRRAIVARFGARYGVSQAVAANLPRPTGILPNSYDPSIFHPAPALGGPRWKFGCVARLVSDKGVDIFLNAVGVLRDEGFAGRCAVVGEGPEREELQMLARRLGLAGIVDFLPPKSPPELANFYHRCEVCVAPSRWREPFGLVALEAIACGTPVIVAKHGGLPEAAGACGDYFPPGDVRALALRMFAAISRYSVDRAAFERAREDHLGRFQPDVQLSAYETAMERLVGASRRTSR